MGGLPKSFTICTSTAYLNLVLFDGLISTTNTESKYILPPSLRFEQLFQVIILNGLSESARDSGLKHPAVYLKTAVNSLAWLNLTRTRCSVRRLHFFSPPSVTGVRTCVCGGCACARRLSPHIDPHSYGVFIASWSLAGGGPAVLTCSLHRRITVLRV